MRTDDLRFTYPDTRTLVNDVLGLGLDRAHVERVFRRTEGWVAGLYLVVSRLRGRQDTRSFIEEFAGDDRHVVDYLGAEVIRREPDDVRHFLLHTSVLERLSGPLATPRSRRPAPPGCWSASRAGQPFLVPLDTRRTWYRYHRFFRELLRHELDLTHPGVAVELHRRASAWHRDRGSIADAVEHALAAGDDDDVADLVCANWADLLQEGRLETVVGWLDALPAATVEQNPGLCLTRGWIAINLGRIDELDRWIAAAESATNAIQDADVTRQPTPSVPRPRCCGASSATCPAMSGRQSTPPVGATS